MGGQPSKADRQIYNNSDKDVQIHRLVCERRLTSAMTDTLQSETQSRNYDERTLLATIPARSSKTLTLPKTWNRLLVTFDGICSIRDLPEEGDVVIEILSDSLSGLVVSPFSRIHHVDLPSHLMSLDALLSRTQNPKLDSKLVLNRTLSTAVPSPISTPTRRCSIGSSASTARAACVLAATIRSWSHSSELIRAKKVLYSPMSRPIEAIKRGRFGECLVLVGGLLIPVGHLDVDWQSSRAPVDCASDEDDVPLTKKDAYKKLKQASTALLGCSDSPSRSEIVKTVGLSQSDIAVLLAGAILLNDFHDAGRDIGNPFDSLDAAPCMVL